VRYEKINMEVTAATATAIWSTAMGPNNETYLFTVCLDHRMRVWDVKTGQILYTGDILNTKRDPQDVGKWTIQPTQTNLIRIVENGPGQCLVVTFSPVGAGEFKIWKVKANRQGSILVADCFPTETLIPPSPSSLDVWTMADFVVAKHGSDPELWTLWKNNITYRVQRLRLRDEQHASPFGDGWKGVHVDNTMPAAQTAGPCDPLDSTEKWLDLIFFPGRFSKATLETALAMYEKGLGTYKESTPRAGKSLAESICSVLGATTTLDRNASGATDYEQFRGTSETQWMRFWRLLHELDKQRGEALSLVSDPDDCMIWVACADCVSAIRQSSDVERLYYNLQAPENKQQDIAALVSAGLTFLDFFSDNMYQQSRAALDAQLYVNSAVADDERIGQFFEKAGFYRHLSDDDCSQMLEMLGDDFRMVTPRLYEDLFDLITSASEANSQELREPFTGFGRKLVVRAIQETIELHWQILFSQLLLLAHMELEYDPAEVAALHNRFDVGLVFRRLIDALKRLEHLRWMAKTELNIPASRADRMGSASAPGSPMARRGNEEMRAVTALEGSTGHLLGLPEGHNLPLMSSITDLVLDICSPGSSTELNTWLLQCWLLKQDRPDLALELNAFAEQDPFATYVQGRVFLALKDYDAAAVYFRKASIGLSIPQKHAERHSAGLLDDTEWNLLNSGLPNYYAHIVNLYDRQRAYSHVIEFSRLSLQFVNSVNPDNLTPGIKTEMLSRLFTASTAISHFETAHSALLSMPDEAMQKSYLRRIVEKMCETGQNAELVSLPFSGLQTKVDEILLEKCRETKDVVNGVPYHQILYAWRIIHNDYRGGAAVLLDRLQKLRQMGEGDKVGAAGNEDALDTQVTRQYLLLINALSCVPAKEAYILEDVVVSSPAREAAAPAVGSGDDLESHLDDLFARLENQKSAAAEKHEDPALAEKMKRFSALRTKTAAVDTTASNTRRKLLTLADLRKQYQQELDRIAAIQNNQFGFTGEGDDDEDVVMDSN